VVEGQRLCRCCNGAGTLPTDRALCPCQTQERDLRVRDLLSRTELLRQRITQTQALRGLVFDSSGEPLPPHGLPWVDYRDGRIRGGT